MSIHPAIKLVESKHIKKNVPVLRSGDVIRVHQRIIEAGKERVQVFEGLVISVCGSRGMDASFTVRRIASGVGVERTYSLHSPKIARIERVKASKVRQAKLYYIRKLTGRKARLKSDSVKTETWEEVPGSDEVAVQDEANTIVDEDFETIEENAKVDAANTVQEETESQADEIETDNVEKSEAEEAGNSDKGETEETAK